MMLFTLRNGLFCSGTAILVSMAKSASVGCGQRVLLTGKWATSLEPYMDAKSIDDRIASR